jgi:HSP20 family protein
MNIAKLNPWNWFKKEERHEKSLPIQTSSQSQPVSPMQQFHSEIDRIFENTFRGFFPHWEPFRGLSESAEVQSLLKPNLDVGGTETEYTVSIELPGVSEKDISLELQNDALIISGQKRHEQEDKGKGYYRMERSYGSFQRVLALPEDAYAADIKAAFKDGVLKITIPRRKELAANVKQIEINKE